MFHSFHFKFVPKIWIFIVHFIDFVIKINIFVIALGSLIPFSGNKKNMKSAILNQKILFIFLFFAFIGQHKSLTLRYNLVTGAWNDPAIWSPAGIPACGDSIVISAGTTVSNTTQMDYTGCPGPMAVTIWGTSKFTTGFKLKLPCGSKVTVGSGGSIQPGAGGGASNYIEICGAVVWDAGDGPYTGPSCLPPTPCGAVGLPVELSSFTATINSSEVDLLWTTQSEKNSLKFDIERSEDATSFIKIGSENSKARNGNSTTPLDYIFADKNPVSNTNYYRLKQIDIDKSFVYSNIISVSVIKETNIKFVIYPNPNQGEFTADISGIENNHNVTILLHDQKGMLHYKSNFFIQDSNTKVQIIPQNKLDHGVYICSMIVEEVAFKLKVIVN